MQFSHANINFFPGRGSLSEPGPPHPFTRKACRLLANTHQTACACVYTGEDTSAFSVAAVDANSVSFEGAGESFLVERVMYPTIHSNNSVGVPSQYPAHSGQDSRDPRSATANGPSHLSSSPSSSNALPVLRVQIADHLSISPPVSPLQPVVVTALTIARSQHQCCCRS